jgi:hypothetical protein
MRGVRFVLALTVAWSAQVGVSFAETNWWDHLSGPGPFWGLFVDYRFGCFSSVPRNPERQDPQATVFTFLKPSDRTAFPGLKKRPAPTVQPNAADRKAVGAFRCQRDELHDSLILSLRFNQSYSNEITPRNSRGQEARVRITALEFGHVRRLRRGWSLRDTIAVNRFSGDQFTTFYNGSNTIALEFAPYAVTDTSPSRWVKVIMGATILYGGFEASSFCNRTATNPQCQQVIPRHFGTEVIPMVSFVVDPSLRP